MSGAHVTSPPARLRVGVCLSLTGQYTRFGTQAAHALSTWVDWHGGVDLVVEDDESNPHTLERVLPAVAERSDVLLGPYSTQLAKTAARLAVDHGWLIWNHGGSGNSVENDYPGHVVSILTPTSGYADPFLRYLATEHGGVALWLVHGTGSFGRHITASAVRHARELGIDNVHVITAQQFADTEPSGPWVLFSVGRFEDDITTMQRALALTNPPTVVCGVAAGVHEFRDHIDQPEGVFGVAQWFPGNPTTPELGPGETEFLRAYTAGTHATPDYPAIQAVAGAVLAEHCASVSASTAPRDVWAAAIALDTTTLFGDFGIDPATGAQRAHSMALLRWGGGQLHRPR
jgi:branched-chain amino acid transport system substrate-binding protein